MPTDATPATQDPFLKGVFDSPLIKAVQSGDSPPIYAPPSIFGSHAPQVVPKLLQGVQQIGLGAIEAPKAGAIVVFNPKLWSKEEILQADAKGQLDQVAIPVQVQGSQGAQGGAAPQADPNAAAQPPQAAPAAPGGASAIAGQLFGGGGAPSADPAQAARLAAQQPQPPVKKPMPSQGILNSLTSRAM